MPLTPDQLATLQGHLVNSLTLFGPELAVVLTLVGLLLARLVPAAERVNLLPAAAGGVAVAFGLAVNLWLATAGGSLGGPAFADLVSLDLFALFVRGLLLLAAGLVLVLARTGGIPDAADSADFAVLLLGGTLGMMLMSSASHLLTVFIGLEMASLPSYALAGFLKGRRTGSEAALKYAVYGAAASGVALFGISLLVAAFGGGSLDTVARGYKGLAAGGWTAPAAAGTLLLLVGFAFKLSAVPFHFWCPDVFDGAAAEVAAFLAVASKAAAVAVLVRFAMTAQSIAETADPTFLPRSLGAGLLVLAGVTATVGNLAALAQTSLKRMLAYSTVAHAGYMLAAVAVLTPHGVSAVLAYLATYLPANLGAFAVVAALRNATGGETVDHARGLIRRDPGTAVCLTLFLLSLLGLPPLAGFAGKFLAFEAVYSAGVGYWSAGQHPLGVGCYVLLGVGVLNTAVSAGYYLRVIKAAMLDDPPTTEPVKSPDGGWVLLLLATGVVALGVAWDPLLSLTTRAAEVFETGPR